MSKEQVEVRELQEGSYVMIDEEPCIINSYSTSKPGKHGSAKARVDAEGVFDGQKRTLTQPVDSKVWVPIIDRNQGQVVNVEEDEMQVMDLETYDTFRMKIPDNVSVEPDDTVEFLEWEEHRKIVG